MVGFRKPGFEFCLAHKTDGFDLGPVTVDYAEIYVTGLVHDDKIGESPYQLF